MKFIFLLGPKMAFLIVYLIGFFIAGIIATEVYKSSEPDFRIKRIKCAVFWPWYLVKGFIKVITL